MTTANPALQTFDHEHGDFLDAEGARLYYQALGPGDAPALLFLHGGFGDLTAFNRVLPELHGRWRLIGLDARGHGRSGFGHAPLSYAQLQRDVQALLAHLGLDEVSVFGFSDGGIVGLRLAATGTVRVPKLVTLGAQCELPPDDPARALFTKMSAAKMRAESPAMAERYERLNPDADFDRHVREVMAMWVDEGVDGYPGERVRAIESEVLVLRGADDHLISSAHSARIAELVTRTTVIDLAGAGHSAFDEQPEVFIQALNAFFNTSLNDEPV